MCSPQRHTNTFFSIDYLRQVIYDEPRKRHMAPIRGWDVRQCGHKTDRPGRAIGAQSCAKDGSGREQHADPFFRRLLLNPPAAYKRDPYVAGRGGGDRNLKSFSARSEGPGAFMANWFSLLNERRTEGTFGRGSSNAFTLLVPNMIPHTCLPYHEPKHVRA